MPEVSRIGDDSIFSVSSDSLKILVVVFFSLQKIDIQAAVAELMSSIKPNLGNVDIIDASIFTNLALAKAFVQTGVNFSSFQALVRYTIVHTLIY